MSMQNKNLYALLGNDVSGDEDEFIAPKEIVAPQKSTKKSGVPPKDDPSRSKGGKPKPTGNEAGARFSNKNRESSGPKATQRKNGKDKKFDRHSRTGKTETAKSQHNKLGDEAESQIEAEADAEAEQIEEAAEQEEKPQLKSAADFFNELASSEFQQSKAVASPASTINDEDLVVKVSEEFLSGTAEKKLKQKSLKTKQFLDVNITVTDGYDRPERPERSDFQKGSRKPKGKFNGKPKGGKPKASKPVNHLTEQNFPSL